MRGVPNIPGPSLTLGLLGPSHQWCHKSRASLRGPPCAHGVADTPQGEVRDRMCRNSARSKSCDVNIPLRLLPSEFRQVGRREGKAPPRSLATQKKDYDRTVAGCWCSRKMLVRATILIPLFGPNPTAPAPGLFSMRRSGYRR